MSNFYFLIVIIQHILYKMTELVNYRKEELTINAGKAQLNAIIYFIPFAFIFGILFYIFWGVTLNKDSFKNLMSGFGGFGLPIISKLLF